VPYDLAIVGSGGAGFAAAIAAATRGLSVVMIERGTIGGTCVNVGCIPSKALLAAAEARHAATASSRFPGIEAAAGPVDMAKLVAGKADIVTGLRAEKYEDLAADYGWEVRRGTARFIAGPALEVDGQRVEAAHYLVAAGASAWAPEVPGLAEAGYLTSTTALDLDRLPESLIVAGGNYVGLELGQLFARLGVAVTLVEALPRLAPGEEPEVSQVIADVLADEGVTVRTSAPLTRVRAEHGGVVAETGAGELRAEAILMATGRRANTAGLGLEAVGVKTGRLGEVVTDGGLRTANPRIWAAGDVTGAPQFVYVAAAHGTMVVDNAFGGAGRIVDYAHLPRVTFTSPAIAAVGLTDAQVAGTGLRCTCRVLPLDYVPRAIVNRDTRGLVKIVAEAGTGAIKGVHIIAEGAGDMILAATYALTAGMTTGQLATTWAPYLTMAEALKLAAQSFTTDVAKLSCCAA
jgi:mercuric reductase